jgi:hypothetical protein
MPPLGANQATITYKSAFAKESPEIAAGSSSGLSPSRKV